MVHLSSFPHYSPVTSLPMSVSLTAALRRSPIPGSQGRGGREWLLCTWTAQGALNKVNEPRKTADTGKLTLCLSVRLIEHWYIISKTDK